MLILSNDDIEKILPVGECLDVLEDAYRDLGNGMAAARFVDELGKRALGRHAVAVIGEEPRLAYNRVLLSALLADEDHGAAEAYDVWAEKSMYGKKYMGIVRSAFLIDEKGKIADAWYKVSPKDTPANLLNALGS